MLRTEAEARKRLGPIAPRLQKCVARAIESYRDGNLDALRADLTKRSHASNVNDLIWANLRSEFEGDFAFTEKRNRRLMHVGNEFSIRVKKLDPNMRPHNILTQLALDFLEQRQPLAGMDPPTNVDLAYRLVGIAEVAFRVYLRCPRSRTAAHWLWELEEPAGVSLATVEDDPGVPQGSVRRARPRQVAGDTPREEPSAGSPA